MFKKTAFDHLGLDCIDNIALKMYHSAAVSCRQRGGSRWKSCLGRAGEALEGMEGKSQAPASKLVSISCFEHQVPGLLVLHENRPWNTRLSSDRVLLWSCRDECILTLKKSQVDATATVT